VIWDEKNQEITLTRYFQTRRLIVGVEREVDFTSLGATDILEGPDNMTILQFATVQGTQVVYEYLSKATSINWIQPDIYIIADLPSIEYIEEVEGLTSLSSFEAPWNVTRTGLDVYAAYTYNRSVHRQMVVAVIDSGFNSAQPNLQGRMEEGWNVINNNSDITLNASTHGTRVAEVIVDATPRLNNIRILPVIVFDNWGQTTSLIISDGIHWAVQNGADVLNLSFGSAILRDSPSTPTELAAQYALNRGITVVVGAGNMTRDVATVSPARMNSVITVASTGKDDRFWAGRTWGSIIDLAAPGPDGTSFAAPLVTAATAMYIMNNSGISPAKVQAALRGYVDVPEGWDTSIHGTGILNMELAIEQTPGHTITLHLYTDRSRLNDTFGSHATSFTAIRGHEILAIEIPVVPGRPRETWESQELLSAMSEIGHIYGVAGTPGYAFWDGLQILL